MANHYQIPIKCMACGLHYLVLTEDEEWTSKVGKGGSCPECRAKGMKIIFGVNPSEEFIFQIVPGEGALAANARTK